MDRWTLGTLAKGLRWAQDTSSGVMGTAAQLRPLHCIPLGHPNIYGPSQAWSSQISVWHSRPLPTSFSWPHSSPYLPLFCVYACLGLCAPPLPPFFPPEPHAHEGHSAVPSLEPCLVHSLVSTTRIWASMSQGLRIIPYPTPTQNLAHSRHCTRIR